MLIKIFLSTTAIFICLLSNKTFSQSYIYPDKFGLGYGYSTILSKYSGSGHSGVLSFGVADIFFGYSEAEVENVKGTGYTVGLTVYRIKESKRIYPGFSVGYAKANNKGGLSLGVSVTGDLINSEKIRIMPECGLNIILIFGGSGNSSSDGYGSTPKDTPLSGGTAAIYGGINFGAIIGKSATFLITPGFNLSSGNSYFTLSAGLSVGLVKIFERKSEE